VVARNRESGREPNAGDASDDGCGSAEGILLPRAAIGASRCTKANYVPVEIRAAGTSYSRATSQQPTRGQET
jgi:hypothetical protein